jgi:hypothetical protein
VLEAALLGVLLLVMYLIVLNSYLSGLKSRRADTVLGGVLLSLLIVAFAIFGWRTGLKAIAVCIIGGGIARPLARATARFLYAHPPKR